jgi:hypothetical protein
VCVCEREREREREREHVCVFRREVALRYIHMIHICVFVSLCIYYYEAFGFAGGEG